jgi:outer membrane protein assembly factor BamA
LNQLLLYFPYQIFTDNNQFQFTGELGYYRFVFDYYGIGNDQDLDFREVFTVAFPRFKFQSLYGFRKNQFAGIRYWMDDFRLLELDPNGQLAQGTITGSSGGLLSGLGLVYQLDTRNSIFSSTEGWFTEVVFFYNSCKLGSDFNYIKQQIDLRYFKPINKRFSIALQGYTEFNIGDAPFNQLALLGGTKKLRGYYEGRYRDNYFSMIQSELRYALFWRFHGVLFLGAGVVADKFSTYSLSNIRPSVGAGLRFALNEQERIFLRLDYAIGFRSSGFYVTVGEAF